MRRGLIHFLAAIVGLALALPLSAASDLSLSPAKTAVKLFPATPDFVNMVKTLNPKDAYAPVYQGLYDDILDVNGVKRSFKVYIPASAKQGQNNIVVAVPSGVDAVAFLEASGWMAIADKYSQFLFVLEGVDKKWNVTMAADEVAYITKAFARVIDVRPYYNNNQFNFRFIGYGDGGQMLQQYIMSNPKLCSALVVVDGSEIPEAYMQTMAKTPTAHNKALMNSEIKTQVWIITEEMTPGVQKTVDYWAKADKCDPVGYTNGKTTVYMESAESLAKDIEESIVAGRVQVTEQKTNYIDPAANEKIYTDYMLKNSRYGLGCLQNTIIPPFNYVEKGVRKVQLEVDGYVREWWEYVPPALRDSKDPVPLVVVNHGSGQTGEIMVAHHSEWYKVANARGFILAFPSAFPYTSGTNCVPRPQWNALADPTRPDDVKFLNELVKKVEATYNIDPTRVYLTGQSLGCMMSHLVAMQTPETFAAIGATSGPIMGIDQPNFVWPANINTTGQVPIWVITGENDIWPGGFTKSPVLKATMAYWVRRFTNGDIDKPYTYKSGRFQHQLWFNEVGVPIVRYSITMGRAHNNIADESWMIWDEHFSKYRRVGGKIEYMRDPSVVK